MPYRQIGPEDPDLDKRIVLAATELGRRRNRLETFGVLPLLGVIGLLWTTGRWIAALPIVVAMIFGGRAVVRARALAWADELARRHQVPKERMRELARTIRFP
jgi:hypothetical protein